jgi:hypothetical protein
MIHLFNWGEPMLHPHLNDIIKICGKYGLLAFISSNMTRLQPLDNISLNLLTGVGVSLSGFSDSSYGRIHGKSLRGVLENINKLYLTAVKANCRWRPHILWHRYKFNENEMPVARDYFQNRGIEFHPDVASLNGIDLMMDYLFDNHLQLAEREKIEKDLFVDYLKEILHLSKTRRYSCPQWSYLSIDENVDVLLCCGWSNKVKQSVLGPLFDIPANEIKSMKRNSPLCKKCIQSGIAKFGHNNSRNRLFDEYLSKGKHTSTIAV